MSLIVLSMYYALRLFDRLDYIDIFSFTLFSAFATNVRVNGASNLFSFFNIFIFYLP